MGFDFTANMGPTARADEARGRDSGNIFSRAYNWLGKRPMDDQFSGQQGRLEGLGTQFGQYEIPEEYTRGLGESSRFNMDLMKGRNSVAQAQARAMLGQQASTLQSQAALGQGGAALAARNATQAYGRAAAETTQQANIAGLQERQLASNQYLKGLGLGIGSDLQAQQMRQQGMLGVEDLRLKGMLGQAGQPTNLDRILNAGSSLAAIYAGMPRGGSGGSGGSGGGGFDTLPNDGYLRDY